MSNIIGNDRLLKDVINWVDTEGPLDVFIQRYISIGYKIDSVVPLQYAEMHGGWSKLIKALIVFDR